MSTWNITSMNSPFGSTGAGPKTGGSFSTGLCSRRSPSSPSHTNPWSNAPPPPSRSTTTCRGYLSEVNTHCLRNSDSPFSVGLSDEQKYVRKRRPGDGQDEAVRYRGVGLYKDIRRGNRLTGCRRCAAGTREGNGREQFGLALGANERHGVGVRATTYELRRRVDSPRRPLQASNRRYGFLNSGLQSP